MPLLLEDAIVILSGAFAPLVYELHSGAADFSFALREEGSGKLCLYLLREPNTRLESIRDLNDFIAQVRSQVAATSGPSTIGATTM